MTTPSATEKIEYWFIFQNDRMMITKDIVNQFIENKLITTPLIGDVKNFFLRQYLIVQSNDFIVYCAELSSDHPVPANIDLISLRKALELLGKDWYNIAVKAYAIINWDKNHQYCGRCGTKTAHKPKTFERVCPSCSLVFYPRISPSIIVLIEKGDQILMARGHHFIPGAYGLIAGFIESGESAEDAVHREVKEEVGLKIKNLRYFGSQSWPFPDSLMIAFTAKYASGKIIINRAEIEDAGWYRIDNLPGRPSSSISIARKLVDHFIAKHKGQT